jgi:NADH:ubiquinone oxidoreductase subunit 5 (subunit L)/multisubunit Na+/H+ antiporter MnhA subunit
MGIYGVLRMFVLLRFASLWWLLLGIGLLGGLVAIAIALYQRDMKRVLAYSSVENIGIIALGIGVGMYGVHANDARVAVLGFTGALFHVWNHALMKSLLFLGAGSVLHGAGSKDLDRLGGIMKRMPWTATLLIVGAVAISALPPMNGFASEWLIYLGLADQATRGQKEVLFLLAIGAFAMLGATACFCFMRLAGIGLLGVPRSGKAETAHESPRAMIGAMAVLAVLSAAIGLAPSWVVRALAPAVTRLAGGESPGIEQAIAPLGLVDLSLWAGCAICASLLLYLIRRRKPAAGPTWGCGYPASTSRIQYVASSFSESYAEHLLPKPFRARLRRTGDRALFAPKLTLDADAADPMTRGAYEPFLERWAARLSRLRWMQQGVLHVYLLYILAIALIGVAWLSARELWQP